VAQERNAVNLAIYIHWPYCVSKCPYCDFNSHVANSIDHAAWRDAYKRELQHYAALLPGRRVTSIFFGGGTPSLMEPETAKTVIDEVARLWTVDSDVEITLEANPSSVEAEKFRNFRAGGINRLSLGVQALNDNDLKFLGRAHGVNEAKKAIALAAENFPRFSFDLIYARQGQSVDTWEKELREALALAGSHLSLYQLTIEPGTQFGARHQRGEALTAPDPEAALMFERTQDIMRDAGLPAYEISNHAKVGYESRHNLAYWHYDDYIGIGPGAHGRYTISPRPAQQGEGGAQNAPGEGRFATDNHRAPDVWLKHINSSGHGIRQSDVLDQTTAQREAMMMGLRLAEGISQKSWRQKFGSDLAAMLDAAKLAKLKSEGYLVENANALQATSAGLQRLNAVLDYLLN
jgi:oxygen-independent coproporphyrinogen-3 oxidase